MPPPPADAGVPRSGPSRSTPRALLLLTVALLIAWVATAMLETRHPSEVQELVHWRPIAEAEAAARQTGRPILYDFTADWCPPCRLMRREVFADPRHAAA